jgi:hypothetical protein
MRGYVFFDIEDIEDTTLVVHRDQILRVSVRVDSGRSRAGWVLLDLAILGHKPETLPIGDLSEKVVALANEMKNDLVGPDLPVWHSVDNTGVADVRYRFKDGEWSRMVVPPMVPG